RLTRRRWVRVASLYHYQCDLSGHKGETESRRTQLSKRRSHQAITATSAAQGIVMIQAQTTRPATPQRTALKRFSEPTPRIDPVIVCVVLMGMPFTKVVKASTRAAPVSAHAPSTGRRRMIRCPIVLTIRQPPHSVPRPIAMWQAKTTSVGTLVGASNSLVALLAAT